MDPEEIVELFAPKRIFGHLPAPYTPRDEEIEAYREGFVDRFERRTGEASGQWSLMRPLVHQPWNYRLGSCGIHVLEEWNWAERLPAVLEIWLFNRRTRSHEAGVLPSPGAWKAADAARRDVWEKRGGVQMLRAGETYTLRAGRLEAWFRFQDLEYFSAGKAELESAVRRFSIRMEAFWRDTQLNPAPDQGESEKSEAVLQR